MEEQVALDDVQGLILKGYGNMPHAAYFLLQFQDAAQTKGWLAKMANQVTAASTSSQTTDSAVNLALSSDGVHFLGLDEEELRTFPREFEEGMVRPHRQRILGDFGKNDPKDWEWGGTQDPEPFHALLLLYAKSPEIFSDLQKKQEAQLQTASISLVKTLDTNLLPQNREHFGFRDGISDPVMKHAQRREEQEDPINLINPGEFLFGYKNEYDRYPFSPRVSSASDRHNLLQTDKNFPELKDLGKNGSMLVFRQLAQDVPAFWKFMAEAAEKHQVPGTSATMEHLASKMVGRWPNGSPLTLCPHQPDEQHTNSNNFGYAKHDFDGMECPIGAHIRRTNPRDNFLRNSTNSPKKDIEKSKKFVKRFRILRRGRPYGPPLSPSLDPQEMLKQKNDNQERGLHFLCFNASIARQFELIQQTWINNPKFGGLYEDPDPITGYPEIMGKGANTTFTEPAQPLRKKVTDIPQFVHVKGGAYFFMPGIRALRYLGSL